jgi:hypothetical protein
MSKRRSDCSGATSTVDLHSLPTLAAYWPIHSPLHSRVTVQRDRWKTRRLPLRRRVVVIVTEGSMLTCTEILPEALAASWKENVLSIS